MKKSFLFAVAAVALASCSNDVLTEQTTTVITNNGAITFENTLAGKATRTSQDAFAAGNKMAIYGYQDGDLLFNNQSVELGADGKWSYTPLKYWNVTSGYEFYGIYPHGNYYTFENKLFKVADYVIVDAITDQIDLMIAQKNETTPLNTVTMKYNHILSNVNFVGKVSDKVYTNGGISKVIINNFTISDLKNKGSFAQTATATGENVEGTWSNVEGTYPFPDTKNIEVNNADVTPVIMDLLMMPQTLHATLSVNYTIEYTDGTKATFDKSIPLESIKAAGVPVTAWNMNTLYTYTMTLDPTVVDLTQYGIDWDGTVNYDCDPTPESKLEGDSNETYVVVAGDETYPLAWEDLDGDGLLEAGVDRDGDGLIDNVDGNATVELDPANTEHKGEDQVTDGKTQNPNDRDVVLVDLDNDGFPETQIEAEATYSTDDPTKCLIDWNGSWDAYNNASTAHDDEITPVNNSKIVEVNGVYYVWYDENADNVQDAGELTEVHWKDIDGDGWEEAFIGDMDGDNADNAPDVNNKNPLKTVNPQEKIVTDNCDKNPKHYDVIQLWDPADHGNADYNGELCEKQWERKLEIITKDNVIRFKADVIDWNEKVYPEVNIIQ